MASGTPIQNHVPDPLALTEVPPITQPHPRLILDAGEIALMRKRVNAGEEPWHTAWLELKQGADTALGPAGDPQPYTGRDSYEFLRHCGRDGTIAHDLAIAYWITLDEKYAIRAVEILKRWAAATPLPASNFDPEDKFPNTGMATARASYLMIIAYDLLASLPVISADDSRQIEAWFRVLAEPMKEGIRRWHDTDYFGNQFYQNHLVSHTVGIMAVAFAIGDRELAQFAIDSPDNPRDFKELVAGMILMPGDAAVYARPGDVPVQAGEIMDRYRHDRGGLKGLAYCHLSLAQMTLGAEIAWHNGLDFYAYTAPGGENLRLPFEFYGEIFRERDSTLRGGYYAGERLNPDSTAWAGIYEVAHKHYPDSEIIRTCLGSLDRSQIQSHPHTYFSRPVLTHGQPLGPPAGESGRN